MDPFASVFACLYGPGNLSILIECARQFSPYLEEHADAVLFDLTGMEKMLGPPASMAAQIAARVGIPANVAIAPNPDCAFHAARGITGITVISKGEEARTLSALPVNLLEAPPAIAETFEQWGIRRFGELAALPPLGIAARLGDEGLRLQSLAKGDWTRLLRPVTDALRFRDEFELEHPVDLLEPLAFLLSRMLHEICAKLQRASLAAIEVRLRLYLEDESVHARTLRFPLPITDPRTLLKLLQLDLESHPPAAPVVKIYLEAEPARPRIEQQGLFLPSAPEPEKVELTIARICSFIGAGKAGTPVLDETHRPDAFHMVPFGSADSRKGEPAPAAPSQTRAGLRRSRPPRAAQVELRNGRPARVQSLDIYGKVTDCSGPWTSSGDWWSEDSWNREEWDVALSTGPLLRIYLDHRTGKWFIDGSYD